MRALVLIILISITALAFAGCDTSSGTAPPTQTGGLPVAPDTIAQSTVKEHELESLRLALDAEDSIKAELQNRIRAIPEDKKRYSILFVEPDPNVDYKILRVVPDPNKKFSIIVVEPDSGKTNPDLTQYFEDSITPPDKAPHR